MVLGLAALLFFRSRQTITRQAAGRPPSPLPVNQPAFPSGEPQQPTYLLAAPTVAAPETLTVFQTKTPAAAYSTHFADFAKNLGFTGDPVIAVISRGNFSTWNQNSSSLILGGDPIEISYDSGGAAGGVVNLSLGKLEQTALAFVQKLSIVPSSITLSRESIDYFAPKGSVLNLLPTQNGATLVQINFRYLVDNLPLFTRRASAPSLSVKINAAGQVVSLSGYWFPDLVATSGRVSLLDYQAASTSLRGNRGVLTSEMATSDFNTGDISQHAVTTTSIDKAVLGYYYSPGNQTLAPVYVFHGTGTDNNTGKAVSTITLVSALPQQ